MPIQGVHHQETRAGRAVGLWSLGMLLLVASLLPACGARVKAPAMVRASCGEEILDAFGPQGASLVALRPRDNGSVFRPNHLEALDRICQSFQDAMTDDLVAVKCLTDLPIMEGKPSGTQVLVAREEFPMSLDETIRFQQLVLQLEFARGDVIDSSGTLATFIHLPAASFDGVDLRAVFEEQAAKEAGWFQMAFDGGDPDDAAIYREVAGTGPAAGYIVGLVDTGKAGGLKEPQALLAIDRFQVAAEALPKIAQTFTIVDDLKVVRRGLHRGNPSEATVPNRRSEIAQILLARSLSPAAGKFGPRLDSQERVALVRVNFSTANAETRQRIGRRLERLLQAEQPPEGESFLCPEE